jgi:phenylpropionate dioxygenase-like ring-hydroxylating dioxygenase large terminal subunit
MSTLDSPDLSSLHSRDAVSAPADAEDTYLRNLWYFVAPSEQLKRGRTLSREILGEPILLGRTSEGMAFALRDICPHRGIPLRFGSFDGCEVSCGYHGWTFTPDGRCTRMPALPPDHAIRLERVKVESYPCREVQGNVWIFMADPKRPQPPESAEIPTVPLDAEAKPRFWVTVPFPCHADHAIYPLMDPAHAAFVHTSFWWKKNPENMRYKEKAVEPSPLGWRVTRHRVQSENRVYRLLGRDVTTELVYCLPGIRLEEIRSEKHILACLTVVTPVNERMSDCYHAVYASMPWLAPLTPLARALAKVFLGQDRSLCVKQIQGLKYNPRLMLVGDPDMQGRWYFNLKREWTRSQEEGRAFRNPVEPRILRWRS